MKSPGRIDVHGHLLPGMDDGCSTLDESLTCARLLVSAGYSQVFCTPHILPVFPGNNVTAIAARTVQLQKELDNRNIPLHLMPGGEISIGPHLLTTPREDVVTYGLNGRYALTDIWCAELPEFFEPVIRRLQGMGLKIVLAHPERMELLQRDPSAIDRFLEMDLLLQGNLQCFSDPLDSPQRTLVERYLREERYFLLATDMHTLKTLPGRLDGLLRAVELVGREMVDDLTIRNPGLLLPRSAFD